MAEQADIKTDETSRLLDNTNSNYSALPRLRSKMSYPSRSLTHLFKSSRNINPSESSFTTSLGSTSTIDKSDNSFTIRYKSTMLYTRLIIVYFTFLFFISIFGIILHFIPILRILISFTILIILSCFGSLFGMKLIYDWFFIQEQTFADLKQQADKMEKQRKLLSQQKHDLKYNVKALQSQISSLSFCAAECENELKPYIELQSALAERANESETLQDMLDKFVSIVDGMKFLQTENVKALILSKYYNTAFKDSENFGLSKAEYIRFMKKLDTETREMFAQFGGFDQYDQNENGTIELNEFLFMLELVMEEMQEKELN